MYHNYDRSEEMFNAVLRFMLCGLIKKCYIM